MRENLLQELENEYAAIRSENEREELRRRETIRMQYPDIEALQKEREELVFGTMRQILQGESDASGLSDRMEALSARIRSKLAENGLPEDYLSPIYRCPVCKDTGRVGDPVREACECLRKAYNRKLRYAIGLTAERSETFDSFNLSVFPDIRLDGESFSQREMMRYFRDKCENWANQYPDTDIRDILLTGKSGLGKTFLLRAMAERLIERDINVLIISAYRLLELMRQSYFDNDGGSDELMNTQVLMIDDLGSEPLMQNVTIEQLFNLLNERQNRKLSTVISTNLDLVEFRRRYTERIASRLSDLRSCMILTLKGQDVRTGRIQRT